MSLLLRALLACLLAPLFQVGIAARALAADRVAALAVIDRAITAQGGDKALARATLATRTATGTLTIQGKEVSFKEKLTTHLPERFRIFLELGEGEQQARVLVVVKQQQGWQSSGGAVTDLHKARREELCEMAYASWLTTLVPLKKDSAFDLTLLPETTDNKRPVQVVRVACKGHAAVKLFFDRESGLLVKLERQAREAGVAITRETLFREYKEYDGLKLASRVEERHDGKKVSEMLVTSYTFPATLDEGTFAKP